MVLLYLDLLCGDAFGLMAMAIFYLSLPLWNIFFACMKWTVQTANLLISEFHKIGSLHNFE
jgi:hypothetical protein